MTQEYVESPASKVMSEAIDLAIAEESPFPEQAAFVNADTPHSEQEMEQAAERGYPLVLVLPDCSAQVIEPEEILRAGTADAA